MTFRLQRGNRGVLGFNVVLERDGELVRVIFQEADGLEKATTNNTIIK